MTPDFDAKPRAGEVEIVLHRRRLLRLAGAILAAPVASSLGVAASPARLQNSMVPGAVRLTSTPLLPAVPSLTAASMMVAGPADAATSAWASLLTTPLAEALVPNVTLAIEALGGRDGVAGANAFEALSNPDGSTSLLVPGAAAVAWLAGDPRVHFDAGRWIPALVSFGSAVLIGRQKAAISAGQTRLALSTPVGMELSALLGLALLGRNPQPVIGLSDPQDAIDALHSGQVDAVLLAGREVPRRVAALAGEGLRPILSFGADTTAEARDPLLADIPTLPELYVATSGNRPGGALFSAWKACAAASRLDAALVLQPLTPAALVAQWRQAAMTATQSPALSQAAKDAQTSPLSAPQCVTAMDQIIADETTLLALRRWLASRTG